MRVRLVVEFDGSRFSGWQLQANGLSVQEVVEGALRELTGESITTVSSGRTDAGVHARGMVVHFDTHREFPMRAYREGLNRLLPDDVVIHCADAVDQGFHARFSAVGKWYRYTLYRGEVRAAVGRSYSWHIRQLLDLELMREASRMLVGEHDFASFKVSDCDARSSVRRIDRIDLHPEGDLVHVDVVGSGFLRYMVRRIVGTLVEVGLKRRTIPSVEELLSHPGETPAGATAPPHGLCLMKVLYPGEDREFWENFP